MITTLLSGGLGNQMFQYAAACTLAKRLNMPLAIDTYALEKKTQTTRRDYELDVFNIQARKVSTLRGKIFVKARPYIQKYASFFKNRGFFWDEWAIRYVPEFEQLRKATIMSGYFQNIQYFQGYEDDIRLEFTFKAPLKGKCLEYAKIIGSVQSVAVHIRRGDYLSDKSAANNFVTCSIEYYKRAVSHILDNVENPVFFVFSEDMEWVKENLSFGDNQVYFIDCNRGEDSYLDMQLMSLCKHNIIANSSFSWWAAWLNSSKNKMVIAPEKWFQNEDKNNLLDQFYPNTWIRK